MEQIEKLKQFNKESYYDGDDITKKLIELSNLRDEDGQLSKELEEAVYWLKAAAENPYNHDYFRVLYNVLLVITGYECF